VVESNIYRTGGEHPKHYNMDVVLMKYRKKDIRLVTLKL